MRLSILAAVAFVAIAVIGYLVGVRVERESTQAAVADAQVSKTLVVIRRDIKLLTEMREKNYTDLVKDTELWTVLQLQQVDPATFIKGSSSERLYPETLVAVNGYRKQFPDTIINPDKEPTIAKAFAGTK